VITSMGELLARQASRRALAGAAFTAAPPAPPAEAAPPENPHPRIRQKPAGDGFTLHAGGERAATVQPVKDGWRVSNHGAGHATTLQDRRQAEALAWRIARLVAA
jgi:hypothetical protein